jgi:hypothetical protein
MQWCCDLLVQAATIHGCAVARGHVALLTLRFQLQEAFCRCMPTLPVHLLWLDANMRCTLWRLPGVSADEISGG